MNCTERLIKLFDQGSSFLVTTHANPDGDAIGSLLAFGLWLRGKGKEVFLVSPDPVPESYCFLPGSELIILPGNLQQRHYDTGVFLDCSSMERAGAVAGLIAAGTPLVNIDHHISNQHFAALNLVEPEAAATGEILFDLLSSVGGIDPQVATALYVALVTDTGSFRHQNTTPKTHRVAAALLEAGAVHDQVYRFLYEESSRSSLLLLARCLDTLNFAVDGLIAWMEVPHQVLQETGSNQAECEGLVDYPKSLQGVEVGMLFKEQPEGEVRVSLRSKNLINVNRLAATFGGGGHQRAAGCTLKGSLAEVVPVVIKRCEDLIRECQKAEGASNHGWVD